MHGNEQPVRDTHPLVLQVKNKFFQEKYPFYTIEI